MEKSSKKTRSLKTGFQKFATKFKESKKFRIICIILVLLIIVGSFFTWYLIAKKSGVKLQRVYAQVSRGTVTNSIEGTGTVQAISQYEITSLAKGDVIADYFEVGDYVVADQLLYEIDSASVDKSISRQQSNIEKARTNYNEALENVANLNVKSTINGVINNMYVSVGDTVQQGGKIADVINKDVLEITLPFGKQDAQNIRVGDSATVNLTASLTALSGTVTRVATGAYVNSYGVEVTDVEIEFSNPGTVLAGESASAIVGEYACYDVGTVNYISTKTITSKTSGEVKILNKGKGDAVRSGETIVVLESTSVSKTSRDAQLSLQDANLSLDDLYDNLEDYSIKSPIDGKVIQKNIKAGEKLDSNSSAAMAIIADLSKLTFDINIDELDISKISVGQEVIITADALPNRTFVGRVSNISIVGSAFQGVTSYPVTVVIDNTEESDLIPGMNVSAKITVDSVENVLMIPVSAINMGNLVIVKDDGTFKDPTEMMANSMSLMTGADRKNADNAKTADNTKSDDNTKPEDMAKTGDNRERIDISKPGDNAERTGNANDAQSHVGNRQIPQGVMGERPEGKTPENSSSQGADTKQKESQNEENKMPVPNRDTSGNTDNKAAERIKTMIENLDVPEGYTVVMVQTGLTDGAYIEIKEIEGSLKEGDQIVINVIASSNENSQQGQMPGGMGGAMPGGMGGFRSGGMSGGMGGIGGFRSSGMGANRQGAMGGR